MNNFAIHPSKYKCFVLWARSSSGITKFIPQDRSDMLEPDRNSAVFANISYASGGHRFGDYQKWDMSRSASNAIIAQSKREHKKINYIDHKLKDCFSYCV